MPPSRKLKRTPRAADTSPAAGGSKSLITDGPSEWLTYESHYRLREKPFALAVDPRFFYQSPSHASVYEDLLGGIRRREGISVLSGEVGTGKTMVCHAVLRSLGPHTASAFVRDPCASREDLLKVMLMDFGVISVDDLTSGRLNGAARTELSYLLYEFLRKPTRLHASAVVVINEAQSLSASMLEEIRILSESDSHEHHVQVILVGQLELREALTRVPLRHVEHQISLRCSLAPLTLEGTAGYVAHRLHVAGGIPDHVRFSKDGIDLLYGSSHGVPRLINRICDRALNRGHTKRTATIDSDIVREATKDIGLKVMAPIVVGTSWQPAAPPEVPPATVDVWLAALPVDSVPAETLEAPATASLQPPAFDPASYEVPRTYLQRVTRKGLRVLLFLSLWTAGLSLAAAMVMLFLDR